MEKFTDYSYYKQTFFLVLVSPGLQLVILYSYRCREIKKKKLGNKKCFFLLGLTVSYEKVGNAFININSKSNILVQSYSTSSLTFLYNVPTYYSTYIHMHHAWIGFSCGPKNYGINKKNKVIDVLIS